jgi:hypothetical protein
MDILQRIEEKIGDRVFEIVIAREGQWRTIQAFEDSAPASLRYGVSDESTGDFAEKGHGSVINHLLGIVRDELRKSVGRL